jgi:dipeptidyl aminopeptidase/acylaminoacyl peptidase
MEGEISCFAETRNYKYNAAMRKTVFALLANVVGLSVWAQTAPPVRPAAAPAASAAQAAPAAAAEADNHDHQHDALMKKIDDLMWYFKLADVAQIDKVELTGPPPRVIPNPTGQGAGNPVVFSAYSFIPKNLDRSKKHPLIVLVHGGVHSNFTSSSSHIVREMLDRGYAVVSPDYRGSTGYGGQLYRQIDYGGLEIEDVFAARNWMIEQHDFLDPKRVGIVGWSHGGLITLMNIFDHPEAYAVAYAGVPVSDLIARMGYKGDGYRREYSAAYHLGKTAEANVNEYRRRSPVWNAQKLQTPLLVHTNTNDEDVNVLEVEELIRAFKAEGKKFEYKIYDKAPGGHIFNRLDTKLAQDSRAEVYKFLGQYLKP